MSTPNSANERLNQLEKVCAHLNEQAKIWAAAPWLALREPLRSTYNFVDRRSYSFKKSGIIPHAVNSLAQSIRYVSEKLSRLARLSSLMR